MGSSCFVLVEVGSVGTIESFLGSSGSNIL